MATARGKHNPKEKRIAVLAVTEGGRRLAEKIANELPNARLIPDRTGLALVTAGLWPTCDGLVFVMAAGIVTRLVAPLVVDKRHDPAVVVVDEKGLFAVSLLAGHLGGANALARRVATITGGQAVITTASDILGHTPLDLWAREQNLTVTDQQALTRISARLVNAGVLKIFSEIQVKGLPDDFLLVGEPETADCIVSHHQTGWPEAATLLVPRLLVIGIGCNRGATREQIGLAVREAFDAHNLSELAIRNLATIDLKRDEIGLLAFAEARGLQIEFFNKDQLNTVAGVSRSAAVLRATGAYAVAEPAALLSSASHNLLLRKKKWKDITLAIAEAACALSAPAPVV